jgi:hypothetical protein
VADAPPPSTTVAPPERKKNMQALIMESMNTGAKSDVMDACDFGDDAKLQPPTMSDAELKTLRLFFALDLHDNQNTMGTFLKEFIKVSPRRLGKPPPRKQTQRVSKSGA